MLTCNLYMYAQNDYSLRIAGGYADHSDLGEILTCQSEKDPTDTWVAGLDAGYLLHRFESPFELYLYGGFYRFLENGYQDDFYEGTLYFKLFYIFYKEYFRLGFGEGLSYAAGIPTVEYLEAVEKEDHNSRWLNYLDISIDFDLGKVLHVKSLEQTYFGYTIKHRSGVFGLFNDVRHGGSNYNMLHIERKF